jgi:hypothetical protein
MIHRVMSQRVRPEPQHEPNESLERDFDDATAERPERGYRIAGDVVRSAELEQEVGQLKDRLHAFEREIYAARRTLRKRRVKSALSTGTTGATLGVMVGGFLDLVGVVSSADAVIGLAALGFVFGALGGMKWSEPDDNFPAAPPPRMMP